MCTKKRPGLAGHGASTAARSGISGLIITDQPALSPMHGGACSLASVAAWCIAFTAVAGTKFSNASRSVALLLRPRC